MRVEHKKNVILTLSSQLAQCTVKISATAERERGEGGMSLKAGALDTRGPAGRTVEHTQPLADNSKKDTKKGTF